MKSLRISLLGAPLVEVDGQPLVVDTRKAVAILAFLVVTGHAHSRAVVADLLWPDLDGERAAGALRRTLSTLRGALGQERLRSDRSSISIALEGAWFDLAESRAVASDPRAGLTALRAACDLHRDDLMAGFALRDSVRFDDWLRDTQDQVRRDRALLLDRLTDALAAAGQADHAVARARERLALDELHEPTHRRLIELYASAGRRADALVQYRECVRVLDRDLGVAPLIETTELYNAISAGTAPVTRVAEDPPTTGELPMVGRERELRLILDAYGRIGERGVLAMIDGESGVGKTRLAQEAIAHLGRNDARVMVARPHAGEQGLAYGVIASLLRAMLTADSTSVPDALRGDAARLLPELGTPPPTGLDEPGARLRFLETIAHLIAGGFDDSPGVVFIDDLQWCDPASLDALAYVARRLDRRRLLLVCARRTDEPDPERRYAQLAELGERITLTRLTREDVVTLASQSGLDAITAERVFRESEGLPLFVAELMSADDGASAGTGGGVREMLEARLDAVGEMSAQVLSAAAIIGRTFDADDLRTISGRSEEEVALALEELTGRGLVAEREHGYDFSHERLRSVAEQRVGRARRRLLHGRIARALMARHGDHAIIARHLELAGDDERAATEYAAAGDHARRLSARAEAIAHYEAALALGHSDPAGLRESIGDVHTLRGEYSLALAAYNAAAALTEQTTAGRIEQKLGAVHERRGDWELAETHYSEALSLGAERATVQSDRSRVAWRRGHASEARSLGFEALDLADDAGAQAAGAQANNILGLLGCGREYLERSLELSKGLTDPSLRIAALNNLALDHASAGELTEAEKLTREALELCIAHGDRHHEAALRNNLADLLHRAGRSDGAMEELKRAVTAFAAIGSEGDALYPGVWSLVEW